MARPAGIPSNRKGKTYEEIWGSEKAALLRARNSQSHKGHVPWNKGLTVETNERVARYSQNSPRNRGQHHTPEWKTKMSEIMQVRKITWGSRISETKKGIAFSPEHKESLKEAKRLNIHDQLVLQYCTQYEKDGYRCIPLLKHSRLPDIIAIRKSKVYAIEIERASIEPTKYEGVTLYDDIVWILHPKRRR